MTGDRQAGVCRACVRVRGARVCLRVWWSHRRRGEVGRWETGEGVLGNWAGGLSLFSLLDLAASLSLSLYLFCSASLTVVHRILHCKFMAPP